MNSYGNNSTYPRSVFLGYTYNVLFIKLDFLFPD